MEKIITTATVDEYDVIEAYFPIKGYYGISAKLKYANFIEPDTQVKITIEYTPKKDILLDTDQLFTLR